MLQKYLDRVLSGRIGKGARAIRTKLAGVVEQLKPLGNKLRSSIQFSQQAISGGVKYLKKSCVTKFREIKSWTSASVAAALPVPPQAAQTDVNIHIGEYRVQVPSWVQFQNLSIRHSEDGLIIGIGVLGSQSNNNCTAITDTTQISTTLQGAVGGGPAGDTVQSPPQDSQQQQQLQPSIKCFDLNGNRTIEIRIPGHISPDAVRIVGRENGNKGEKEQLMIEGPSATPLAEQPAAATTNHVQTIGNTFNTIQIPMEILDAAPQVTRPPSVLPSTTAQLPRPVFTPHSDPPLYTNIAEEEDDEPNTTANNNSAAAAAASSVRFNGSLFRLS